MLINIIYKYIKENLATFLFFILVLTIINIIESIFFPYFLKIILLNFSENNLDLPKCIRLIFVFLTINVVSLLFKNIIDYKKTIFCNKICLYNLALRILKVSKMKLH